MAKKLMTFKTRGMNRDLSVSAFNPEFSFENHNLRLSTNEGNTLMSWVNEKGTRAITLNITLCGTPIGTAIINNQLVLFTHRVGNNVTNPDYIYLLKYDPEDTSRNTIIGTQLFNGNLGFDEGHPLETLVSYESELIQKVYWVDGKNQPRLININEDTNKYYDGGNPINTVFDFIRELKLQETVHVTKYNSGQGEFPAGVIQYAFTYFTKYGQETNIFYTTPLYYISHRDRGGSPEDKVANSFKIEIDNLDNTFDYLRIYSIVRTSLNGTPIVKRVQDLPISDTSITFTDTNTTGNSVDPTQLLYLGGESIKAKTIEQKDNTLFLGNLTTENTILPDIKEDIKAVEGVNEIHSILDERLFTLGSDGDVKWINTLSCPDGFVDRQSHPAYYEGAFAFKTREYYRLGVQFQYKTGKWSEPVWIGDAQWKPYTVGSTTYYGPMLNYTGGSDPAFSGDGPFGVLSLPEFRYTIQHSNNDDIQTELYNAGYRRMRPVFAQPSAYDRTILCQGIITPTVYRNIDRTSGTIYAQSSWLFRCPINYSKYAGRLDDTSGHYLGAVGESGILPSIYKTYDWDNTNSWDPHTPNYTIKEWEDISDSNSTRIWLPNYRSTEIMGAYSNDKCYRVDNNLGTIHSPDVEFDSYISNLSLNDKELKYVGYAYLEKTFGAIDIQTSTPTISSKGAGFTTENALQTSIGTSALISGNYYNDLFVTAEEDSGNIIYKPMYEDHQAYYWPVFMWHRKGSLNNDVQRENASAKLLKKRISNYRYAESVTYTNTAPKDVVGIELFANTEAAQIIKVNSNIYQGCVDIVLEPDYYDVYAVGISTDRGFDELVDENNNKITDWSPAFTDLPIIKSHQNNINDLEENWWLSVIQYSYNSGSSSGTWYTGKTVPALPPPGNSAWLRWNPLGGEYEDLGKKVSNLGMFKDVVPIKYKSSPHIVVQLDSGINIYDFTGLQESMAVVELTKPYDEDTFFGGTSDDALQSITWIPCGPVVDLNTSGDTTLEYKWGDCFFQRYECLKTYAYTPEDLNQVVEIGSFMLETRVNIDGRYDRNRGQMSNLNANPTNFNLINPVYSQMDNFFNYRILPEDYYKNTEFTNQITWTKTKESGADVDLWTNITLASTLELDGASGALSKLIRFNDQLLAFQDTGISQILYNENAQITTTEGVPIELGNSGKVTGKKYFSNTVGCSNKWSIVKSSAGIYFMDSNEKSIYLFNGQLTNLSDRFGFNAWCKNNIPSAKVTWNPLDFNSFISHFDKINQEVLFINKNTALAFSEKVGNFTSFYDYGNIPYFCNLEDTGLWITSSSELWQHQTGEYCRFFGTNYPYYITLVGNPESQTDKTFTNLEFRACVEGEGNIVNSKYVPTIPFDSLETWNEYQHGIANLSVKSGNSGAMQHHIQDSGKTASLNRKFRMWRCDIPRDNAELTADADLGISRVARHPLDRMRNPWIYIKLMKNAATQDYLSDEIGIGGEPGLVTASLPKTEIHDLVLTYYN